MEEKPHTKDRGLWEYSVWWGQSGRVGQTHHKKHDKKESMALPLSPIKNTDNSVCLVTLVKVILKECWKQKPNGSGLRDEQKMKRWEEECWEPS